MRRSESGAEGGSVPVEALESRRLLAAGALDTTFGTSGIVNSTTLPAANAVVVQPDGKIVVAGGTQDLFVARFNADGSPDATFTTVVRDLGGADKAFAVALQSDGKILVGGGSGTNFAVLRLNANGTADNTFGTGGAVLLGIPNSNPGSSYTAEVHSLAVASGGKIVAAGGNVGSMVVVRLNTNGTPDTTFDGDGIAITPFGGDYVQAQANGVAVQADGKILAGGYAYRILDYDFAAVRYNTNGTLDTTFGTGGRVNTALAPLEGLTGSEQGNSMILQGDGRFLIGGTIGTRFAVARYTPAGALDPTFGGNGITSAAVGNLVGTYTHEAPAMAVGAGGRIIVAGKATNTNTEGDFALVRFYDDGGLDYSWGLNGSTNRTAAVMTSLSNGDDQVNALAVQPDGKVIAAGVKAGDLSGANGPLAMVRYDGTAAPNVAPDANPDALGPYSVAEGGLLLVGGTATDADGRIVKYEWDFDYTGTFTVDASTQSAYFNAAGLDGPATRTIAFRVTDDRGAQTVRASTVTITNMPPALSTAGPRTVAVGSPYTLRLGASDPGPDTISSTRIDWGDGTVQTLAGLPSTADHVYATPGRYSIRVTATDEDGTYAANSGGPDVSFGTAGVSAIDFAPGASDVALATRTLGDGSTLLAGLANSVAYVARLNPDGALDTTFGTLGGYTTFSFGSATDPNAASTDTPYAVDVLADGRIVVAGTTFSGGGSNDWGVAAFDARGRLDTSFGNGGKVVLNFGGGGVSDDARAVLALADGRFYVGGASGGDFAVARFTSAGALDPTFDADGRQTADLGGTSDLIFALARQASGELVAAGRGTAAGKGAVAVARFTASGAPDLSFDTDGKRTYSLTTSGSVAYGVAVQPDGKLVLAGSATTAGLSDFGVLRVNPDGSPDANFGTGGAVLGAAAPGGDLVVLRGAAVLPDGSIVAGGQSSRAGAGSFALLKLTPGGALDPAFGVGGMRSVAVETGSSATHIVNAFTFAGDRATLAGWVSDGKGKVRSTAVRFALGPTSAVIAPARPSVTGSAWRFDSPGGMALRVTFDSDVSGSLQPGDLEIRRAGTGELVAVPGLRVSYDADTLTATFTGLSLPDGNYRATLKAGGVTDALGNPMAADVTFDFFVLAGDVNRDRVVNFDDLLVLAKNYNATGATFAQGDLNFDGTVNFDDLLILAKGYNTSVPAPAPVVTVAAAAPVTAGAVLADDGGAKGKPAFSTTRVAKAAPAKGAPVKPKAVARPKGR